MEEKKLYVDYFDIDPKYYAAVTADLIQSGQVKWDAFYPHETFVNLLEKTHTMLSGKDSRSLWVEGAYGTGKSHAALTVKSLLEASDEEVRHYFADYGLKEDLCEKLIADKNNGRLITIHRIGSASIRSDQDLILAIQDSITDALQEHGIQNRGESSLRDAAIKWLEEKEANRIYFDSLIQEDHYMLDFGGRHVDEVLEILKHTENEAVVSKMMRNILRVAEDNGITALRLDMAAMCQWIKSIIEENDISAILFVWDEFTEYFVNNPNSLTGFQTLAEVSQSHPFYFLIVTHKSTELIQDREVRKKILDRFVGGGTVRIELPENMAFRLMAQAMKTTSDPVLQPEWEETFKPELNEELAGVRDTIIRSAQKRATMGSKTVISDAELQSIVPIHPYAALLLKHMSVAFNSNARSMFDFIISNDMTEAKGFKWFINEYGPEDETNLLTIDMLWDFFTGKGQGGLSDQVRGVLDAYNQRKEGSLTPNEERVYKTALLLEAISLKVEKVELLRPSEQNIDLAFNGTDWAKGKAKNIAAGLSQKEFLFEKPGTGIKEYTAANRGGDRGKLEKLKEETRNGVKTQDLIVSAELIKDAVQLPAAIRERYRLMGAAAANFTLVVNKAKGAIQPNRFQAVVSFALNDAEAASIKNGIRKAINDPSNQLFFIESLVPMGEDLLTQYIDNTAYSKNYAKSNRQQARGFEESAKRCLSSWQQNISNGAFMLYTPENKSGIRVANARVLHEELQRINREMYPCGLEQYTLNDTMFTRGNMGQGAQLGMAQELKQSYSADHNERMSLANALKGAWKVDNYWEDPANKSLAIVRIKQKVIDTINKGFDRPDGRISILEIFEALEGAPFGFIPSNVTAFVLGFVLKEYANANYFWSNGSTSESMTQEKMKQMVKKALDQKVTPSPKYKDEYIVAMSASKRCFLQGTSTAFAIPMERCGSVESARDQIRVKMRGLTFPIWCLKYILDTVTLSSPKEQIVTVIDAYCGIANTANSNRKTESELADEIGNLMKENPAIAQDLAQLLTNELCRNGMLAYIGSYQGGVLPELAAEIGDNGAYLDQVKQKFNADAANWVWNTETADEKISDVILEYHIIAESNRILPKCTNLRDVVMEWNKRSNNIRIPNEVLRKYVGDLSPFLEQLRYMKESGQLQEQYKQTFYDLLLTQSEPFQQFYQDQFSYFKQAATVFLDDIEEQAVEEFFKELPRGQFTKSATEYYQYIEEKLNERRKKLKRSQLKELWHRKTKTKDPEQWSDQFDTPILCMFDDTERGEAKEMFGIICAHSASDADIDKATAYVENATFYDRLNDPQERDRCFMQRVVGEYGIMLQDVDRVRGDLKDRISDKVYNWMDNSSVQNRLKVLAEKQYKLTGCERAMAVIDQMDASRLRQYLSELIADNLTVGMEILKNNE